MVVTDTLVEGVHFPPGSPAASIGHREADVFGGGPWCVEGSKLDVSDREHVTVVQEPMVQTPPK